MRACIHMRFRLGSSGSTRSDDLPKKKAKEPNAGFFSFPVTTRQRPSHRPVPHSHSHFQIPFFNHHPAHACTIPSRIIPSSTLLYSTLLYSTLLHLVTPYRGSKKNVISNRQTTDPCSQKCAQISLNRHLLYRSHAHME